MPLQNFLTIGVDFAVKYRGQASLLEPEIKSSDTCKERTESHFVCLDPIIQ